MISQFKLKHGRNNVGLVPARKTISFEKLGCFIDYDNYTKGF